MRQVVVVRRRRVRRRREDGRGDMVVVGETSCGKFVDDAQRGRQ